MGKSEQYVLFLETVAFIVLKRGLSSQINELMK